MIETTTLREGPGTSAPQARDAHGSARRGKTKQIVGLDLLRFFAAMLVILFHFGFRYWAVGDFTDTSYHYLAPFTCFGFVGVEIFFTLSGFIIAYSAEGVSAGVFARSRILRLYPAAWICSTITATVLVACHIVDPASHILRPWISSLLLSPIGPWIDGTYWTLGIEMVFYAVVFVLLLRHNFRHIGAVVGAIGVLSSAGWIISVLPMPAASMRLTLPFDDFLAQSRLAQLTLLSHGCFFAVGVFLWLCLQRRVTAQRILVLLVCTLGGVLELRIHAATVLPSGIPVSAIVPISIWLLSLVALVLSVRWNEAAHRRLGAHGVNLARTLGLLSYPLYLVHQYLGFVILSYLHRRQSRVPDIAWMLFLVCAMPTLAFCISRWPEPYVRNWLHPILHRPRQRMTPASTLP